MATSDQQPVTDWSTDFDIYDPRYTNDPAPIWDELRAECPFPHTDRRGGMWMATTYEDVRSLAMKTSVFSNRQVLLADMPVESDLLADYHGELLPPITNDPPVHAPRRRIILPFFSPKAVERYHEFTETLCNELIDGFIGNGGCDAATDYAQQITPRVISNMLGIDLGRVDQFVSWVQDLLELGFADIERRKRARRQMLDFFAEMIAERRERPRHDYISELCTKEVEGRPLTDDQLAKYCLLLLVAGIDTTWSSIGSSLYHFATHPEDRRRMAREPELWPSAVEEMLRFYAPVSVGRVTMEDTEFHGCPVKRGDRVMINYPSANRDPEAFERPDEVVLDRRKNRHFAFGVGVHRCAGSNLARMEMEIALRTWFERIPEFELTDPAAVRWAPGQVRGARCVPVRFGPVR